jgi:hypothetical protein
MSGVFIGQPLQYAGGVDALYQPSPARSHDVGNVRQNSPRIPSGKRKRRADLVLEHQLH